MGKRRSKNIRPWHQGERLNPNISFVWKKSCNELDQQNYKFYNIKSFIVQTMLAVTHSIPHAHSCITQQDSLKKPLTKKLVVFCLVMLHTHYTRGQNYSKAFLNNTAKSSGICFTFCQSLLDVFYHDCKQQLPKISWFLGDSRKQRWFKMPLVGKRPLPKPNFFWFFFPAYRKNDILCIIFIWRERYHTSQD